MSAKSFTFRTLNLDVIFSVLLTKKIGKQAYMVLVSETLLVWRRAHMALFVIAQILLVRHLNTQNTDHLMEWYP